MTSSSRPSTSIPKCGVLPRPKTDIHGTSYIKALRKSKIDRNRTQS